MPLRNSIENFRSLGMHATPFHWGLAFISTPALLAGFGTDDLNARAYSTERPSRTINDATIAYRGHKVYQHGICTYNEYSIDLHEAEDSKVQDISETWMDGEWQPITGVQMPKPINQAQFLFSQLNSMDELRRYYTVIGAWLKSFSPSQNYDSTTDNTITFSWSLRNDYYLYNI